MNDWLSHLPDSLKHDTSAVVYQRLKTHRQRTLESSLADVFVVAMPLRKSYHLDRANHQANVDRAFLRLFQSPTFRRVQGRDHLFLAHFWEFSAWSSVLPRLIPPEYLEKLEHVTCTRYEYYGASRWNQQYLTTTEEPKALFGKPWEPTRYSIATPHASAPEIEIVEPRLSSWIERPNWVFYHTREEPFHCGATELRRLPIKHADLFEGSIGFGLPRDQWLEAWSASKFSLIVRGDTPGTTSFVNAVAFGCIPVIISDAFEKVVFPFKQHLDLNDFAITISEEQFLREPGALMPYLRSLAPVEIEARLSSLARAQRLLLYNHPQSETLTTILEYFAKIKRLPVSSIDIESADSDPAELGDVFKFVFSQVFLFGRASALRVSDRAVGARDCLSIERTHGWNVTSLSHRELASPGRELPDEVGFVCAESVNLGALDTLVARGCVVSALALSVPDGRFALLVQVARLAWRNFTLVNLLPDSVVYLNYNHPRTLRLQRDFLTRQVKRVTPDWFVRRVNPDKFIAVVQKWLRLLSRDREAWAWALKRKGRKLLGKFES